MNQSSFLLCANWKMNKNPEEARAYIQQITQLVPKEKQNNFIFFAPALTLSALRQECAHTSFGWGAQNCHYEDKGAFTGENSPLVLKQMGATHCLVGHSERRQFFYEDETLIQKKVKALLKHSIQPVICVGENAEERKNGNSFQVINTQLHGILKNIEFFNSICIAYEPVWAIGSNQPAKPEQISDMQKYIKKLCESEKKNLQFLYGGSVNEENIHTLSQISGVDGFLVGGASLDPQKFFNLSQT